MKYTSYKNFANTWYQPFTIRSLVVSLQYTIKNYIKSIIPPFFSCNFNSILSLCCIFSSTALYHKNLNCWTLKSLLLQENINYEKLSIIFEAQTGKKQDEYVNITISVIGNKTQLIHPLDLQYKSSSTRPQSAVSALARCGVVALLSVNSLNLNFNTLMKI